MGTVPLISPRRSRRPARGAIFAGSLLTLALAGACGSSRTTSGFGGSGANSGSAASTGGTDEDASSSGGLIASDDSSAPGLLGSTGASSAGPSSPSGGMTGCDPSCAAAGGKCAGTTCTLAENPGNVPMATQTSLQGKGAADPSFAWLYPYDKTVFPRGLISPTLQFGGGASDAEYVHITSKTLDYRGYFAGGAAGTVALSLPQKSWDAVTAAVGGGDVATVAVTKISGGSVTGPVSESWPIAQGSIRGTIFYETYGSTIAGGRNSVAILKIQPGAKVPTLFKGTTSTGCGAICHAASADGSTIVSATTLGQSASWNVQSGNSMTTSTASTFTYMAPYPDGSFGMSATTYNAIYNPTPASRLYDTKTGATIAATGWDSVITKAGTPAFSPDGKHITFMHEDTDAHTIASMDFDPATKTFSGLVDLASVASGYVAWPAFTPDDKSVIFQSGSSATFDTDCQNTGDLYVVDVASHTIRRADALDGYGGTGTASYLPAGDPGLDFAPTVLAEAVGGYFWAVFTSHRSYGSVLGSKANNTGLGISNCANPSGADDVGKLWVSAIDIGAPAGKDPSHPAFYLDGQELQADNLRGYWVLPACQANGTSCQTGDECCCGFCRAPATGGSPVCVCKPKGCSNEFEMCTTAADCCTPGQQCINGRCALPTAIQ